ncbi:MAG: polysaccharide biosynthesis/export family protein [Sedimentisphaerales bacterium]|nr:polysaccharide biosynthesis/export family protein [Sedimentisphaerales bacterium]
MKKSQYQEYKCIRAQVISSTCVLLLLCTFALWALSGCADKFWDPTQVGRFRPVPAVNVILDSLGVADETPAAWETGEEPKPADVIAYETDYVFGPGDIVQISIFELFNESIMFTNQYVITETGKVSIPEVGTVAAAGLTESLLEEEIKQILSPNILKEPVVNVILIQSQSRLFSILGSGVPRSGRYQIPRYDYRLADALAAAGGISQFNISYIYISRPITGQEEITETIEQQPEDAELRQDNLPVGQPEMMDESPNTGQQEMMDIIAPMAGSDSFVIASTELITNDQIEDRLLKEREFTTNEPQPASNATTDGPPAASDDFRIEWIFQDGQWKPVRIGVSSPETPTKPTAGPEGGRESIPPVGEQLPPAGRTGIAAWDQIGAGGSQRRVIRIQADKLLSGDPRYNVVIRPGDNIHVPVDIIGEFCIMGNVNAQGFINITGRPMTLKMAIAAAGGLGPLAWPKRCEVVRRIGKKREEIVLVDLDKIAAGEQPDFFIKPNDLINVGTHPTARFRAVLRNSFRATYGFGFIYDRNFADRDYGTGRPFNFLF